MSEKNPSYDELVTELNYLKAENNRLKNEAQKCDRDINRLKSLISNLQMGVLIEGEDRKIVDVNHYFCELFGIPSPDAIRGMDCEESARIAAQSFVDPDGFVDQINSTVKSRKVTLNQQLKRKDGGVYERDYVPVYQGDHFIGDMWIYRDASERKKAEQELRESEEKYRLLSENTSEGVALIENDQVKYVSEGYLKMLGYSKEEFQNISIEGIFSYVHPDDIARVKQLLQTSLEKEEKNTTYELRVKTKSGNYIWLEDNISRVYDEKGNRIRSIIHSRDITERKRAEAKLKESEERFRKLIKNMDEAVVLHNPEGAVVEYNRKARQILELEINQIKGLKSTNFIYRAIYETGEEFPFEEYPASVTLKKGIAMHDVVMGIIKKDDQTTWIRINSEPIYLYGNKNPYAIITFSDITKQKEKERKLTELNATKDKLFSIISHDLRNPCQAMLSLSDLIVKNIKENDFTYLQKQSELLHQSAKQSVNLINNLLQWSRAQTGRLEYSEEHISIKELVENILALSEASLYEKGLITKTDIPEGLKIIGDRFMIELIIRNLVSNAIKYTNKGGKIELKAYKTKTKTTISVSDSGIGIKKKYIDKLFDIGTNFKRPGTNDEKGTGLGLILCKEFTEIQGGAIQVKSVEGKGSTFSITLPAKA